MDGVTMHASGLAEIQRKLLELPNRVNRNVVRHAMVDGAKLIRDEAILQAPMYHGEVSKGHPPPGTLKRSIILKFIPEESRDGHVVYYVTVRHGKKYQHQGRSGDLSQDAYYWFMVEFGTVKMSPHPFMRSSFEMMKGKAKDTIINDLATGVETEAARL